MQAFEASEVARGCGLEIGTRIGQSQTLCFPLTLPQTKYQHYHLNMLQFSSRLSSALKKSSFPSPSLASARTSQLTPTSPASRVSILKDGPRTALNISYYDISFDEPLIG